MQSRHDFRSPGPSRSSDDVETLLSRLSVTVDSITVGAATSGTPAPATAPNQFLIIYVLDGEGTVHWAGEQVAISKGTIAVAPAQLGFDLGSPVRSAVEGNVVSLNRGIGGDLGGGAKPPVIAAALVTASAGHGLGFFENLKHPFVDTTSDPLLTMIFGGILGELEDRGIGNRCLIEALIKQVLVILLRRTIIRQSIVTPLYLTMASPRLAHVINTVEDNYADRLSIPALAKLVGMTPFSLTTEFERVFGESLLDYIQGVRLRQATTLLTQTVLPVKSIAALVGYASRSHFSREFRKRQGEDPTTYRKSTV